MINNSGLFGQIDSGHSCQQSCYKIEIFLWNINKLVHFCSIKTLVHVKIEFITSNQLFSRSYVLEINITKKRLCCYHFMDTLKNQFINIRITKHINFQIVRPQVTSLLTEVEKTQPSKSKTIHCNINKSKEKRAVHLSA